MQVLLATCGAWHLRQTAHAYLQRESLAGLWISEKNSTGLPPEKFHRSWLFHTAYKPFLHSGTDAVSERAFYALFPLWKWWIRNQVFPPHQVVQGILGYATELFDEADRTGALKVVDCPNSHPTSFYGFWQRECDLWCPGERIPIPRFMFARMNRELERADLIIVQSQFCKESMVHNGIAEEKVMVNPMGVDTSLFTCRAEVPVRPRFICVGTISLRKGHQYLFRAFAEVKKALPEAELICVGGYKCDFRRERPLWEGSFTHYPHLRHEEIAPLLQSCTAFVFPSQEEGIARAQIEALACGLPVIGTHAGGTTTLVRDGEQGLIVRPRDIHQLAQAMLCLAGDRERNQRMGRAAHQVGALANSWQDYGDRLLGEFQSRRPLRP